LNAWPPLPSARDCAQPADQLSHCTMGIIVIKMLAEKLASACTDAEQKGETEVQNVLLDRQVGQCYLNSSFLALPYSVCDQRGEFFPLKPQEDVPKFLRDSRQPKKSKKAQNPGNHFIRTIENKYDPVECRYSLFPTR
jgi:hypothetical protein